MLENMSDIRVQFIYSEEHVVRATSALVKSRMFTRIMPWAGLTLIGVSAAYWVFERQTPFDAPMPLMFGLLFALMPLITRYQAKRISKKSRVAGQTFIWTFNAEKISNETDGANASFDWNKLAEIKEVSDGFLLFTQRNLAHWIPKKAFATTNDIETFRGFIRQNKIKYNG